MCRFPQSADLLFLPLLLKDGGSHTQHKKVFEMLGFGIVEASLPLPDCASGDPQQVGQTGLRQANAGAQLKHDLPKGIVALMLEVPRQGRAHCLPRDQAAPNQQCEATGKKHATCHSRYTERCWMRCRRVHAAWGVWCRVNDSRLPHDVHGAVMKLVHHTRITEQFSACELLHQAGNLSCINTKETWYGNLVKAGMLTVLPSAESIVALTIGVPRHGRAHCLARDPAAPSQQCEAIGKKHATCWWLISPGTPAILRGVGRSPGDCVVLEGVHVD
jgi:hypothetical protein